VTSAWTNMERSGLSLTMVLCLCLAGSGLGQQMPRFSFDTLPVAYHGSNTTAPDGMYSPESLEVLARFAMVTLEKYQGINGLGQWDECQNGTDVSNCGCCTEDLIVAVAEEIKKIDPTTMVIGYWHSNKEYPVYRGGQELAQNPDLWCKKEDGTVPGYPHQVQYDHANILGTELWEEGCLAMTNTGFVDGCFMDGCTKDECGSGNPDFLPMKKETMARLQTKTPGVNICGSNGKVLEGVLGSQIQNWGKNEQWSTREIPMLMDAMEAGIVFQAHGPCPSDAEDQGIINNIAAFLVGMDRYAYYMCGTWTNPPLDWFPIYDFPLGAPLANATLGEDGIWRRSFESGTAVTFDTNTETGTIDWAQMN